MPTYEFRCPNGHEFERFYRKISDAQADVACPECGAVAMRLVSGGAGLLFKGSGFYLTDYGRNAHRGGAPGAPKEGVSPAPDAKSEHKHEAGAHGKSSDAAPASSTSLSSSESKAQPAGEKSGAAKKPDGKSGT